MISDVCSGTFIVIAVCEKLVDAVLFEQLDDRGLLVALDPTSDGNDRHRQGLDWRAHDEGFQPPLANLA
jgi:hypothetical protein